MDWMAAPPSLIALLFVPLGTALLTGLAITAGRRRLPGEERPTPSEPNRRRWAGIAIGGITGFAALSLVASTPGTPQSLFTS